MAVGIRQNICQVTEIWRSAVGLMVAGITIVCIRLESEDQSDEKINMPFCSHLISKGCGPQNLLAHRAFGKRLPS